jgi:hypothetical protein
MASEERRDDHEDAADSAHRVRQRHRHVAGTGRVEEEPGARSQFPGGLGREPEKGRRGGESQATGGAARKVVAQHLAGEQADQSRVEAGETAIRNQVREQIPDRRRDRESRRSQRSQHGLSRSRKSESDEDGQVQPELIPARVGEVAGQNPP